MTYIPNVNGDSSEVNSSSTPLGVGTSFTGIGEEVVQFTSFDLTVVTDVPSAPQGVQIQFSSDNVNWDFSRRYTFDATKSYFRVSQPIENKYLRVVYTNGATAQTFFRLHTTFNINNTMTNVALEPKLVDGFNRVRISNPYTLLSNNHIVSKEPLLEHEKITGIVTSTHSPSKSCVDMTCTGAGSVIRRSRQRGIYQPGKSLLVYMTGVLNSGSNDASVTSRIGYYDDDGGYYFQHNNGMFSIVERSSVSGSLVENVVNESEFNVGSGKYTIDTSKTLIFWICMEWLGVGIVQTGVIIEGQMVLLHNFKHSNLLEDVYIQTASLPPTYEIVSTSGTGSMKQLCYTVISEGGYNPSGKVFSANSGITEKTINSTPQSVVAIRLKSGITSKMILRLTSMNVTSTSSANSIVRLFRFVDNTTALTGAVWTSVNPQSAVEYDISSTTIDLTGGTEVRSAYFSGKSDQLTFKNTKSNFVSTNMDGVSDLLVIVVQSISGINEKYVGSMTWREVI